MAERDRIERLEYDLARVSRQIAGMPVRIAQSSGAADPPIQQLAQVLDLVISGTTPHNSQTPDEDFLLPTSIATAVAVGAVLLTTDPLYLVDNPNGETLSELRIVAIDVRKEGLPKIGDIVRVWTSDGKPVNPGESNFADGEFTDQHEIFCEPINAVEELRGLDTWDLPTDQVLVHEAASPLLVWMDAAAFVSGPGGGSGGGGDTVAAGYGIDISGTGTVTIINDPTEWTGFTNQFQFFSHLSTDTAVTDPAWKTVSDYDATKNQMWWHKTGSFKFQTTLTYDAAKNQQLVNVADSWQWLDAWTVKSTIDDTTAGFLHDAIKDNATYVSGQDGIVANATDGASGTNQKERLFLDASAIQDFGSIPDGDTWRLSMSRSGTTYTMKWAASGGDAGVLLATATIAARSGGTPGSSTSYTVVEGTVTGTIYNYSSVAIASGSYMVVVKVADHWIISAAFC